MLGTTAPGAFRLSRALSIEIVPPTQCTTAMSTRSTAGA